MKLFKFSQKDIESISSAVGMAEKDTSGEIATAFIKESDDYAKEELFFSIVIGFIYFTIMLFFIKPINIYFDQHMWEYSSNYLLYFYGFSTFLIIALSYLICNIPFVDRLIISKTKMNEKVHARAMQYFAESNISSTRDRTGILIFISFMEQRVEVIADIGIGKIIPNEKWQQIVDTIIDGIKTKKMVFKLNEAILECGEMLKIHFPIKEDDTNELKDEIHILES